MKIGTVRERKQHEYRVGITPDHAEVYVKAGHQVFVETGAGVGSGFPDKEYIEAGATILPTIEDVYQTVDMLVKVKEPLPEEYPLLKKDLILYTYLHLAADKPQANAIAEKGVKAVAYETISEGGTLPCLRPMSEIAGRLSIQEGAKYIESAYGGRGILLGGVPGVERGKVVIVGGGIAGILETFDGEFAYGHTASFIDVKIPTKRKPPCGIVPIKLFIGRHAPFKAPETGGDR